MSLYTIFVNGEGLVSDVPASEVASVGAAYRRISEPGAQVIAVKQGSATDRNILRNRLAAESANH